MKKLYAGVAAAALAATGIACSTGAATATAPTWPSALGFQATSGAVTGVSTAGDELYTVALDGSDPMVIDVATTDLSTHESTAHDLTLTPSDGSYIVGITAVTVTSTGVVLASATQLDPDAGTYDSGIWAGTVNAGTAAESIAGMSQTGSRLAASPDGSHAALVTAGVLASFAVGGHTAVTAPLGSQGIYAYPNDVAIRDDGTAYAVGTVRDAQTGDTTPQMWTVTAAGAVTPGELDGEGKAIGLTPTGAVISEQAYDAAAETVTTTVEVIDGSKSQSVVAPVAAGPGDLAVSPDAHTAWLVNGGSVAAVDLTALDSYSAERPVPSTSRDLSIGSVVGTDDTLYYTGTSSHWDEVDETWVADPTQVYALTAPDEVTDAFQMSVDNGANSFINIGWTSATDSGGAPASYVVTATDTASQQSFTFPGWDYDGQGGSSFGATQGYQIGHSYTISVQTFNGAFLSDAVTALLSLPDSFITVDGDTTVGSTLSASIDGWSDDVDVAYQWYAGTWDDDANDYSFSAIDGETADSLQLTDALLGQSVKVVATGSKEGYRDTVIDSGFTNPVEPAAETPALPGEGDVSISGDAVSGSTLTADVTGDWPDDATLSYQWGIVTTDAETSEFTPIEGADESTLDLTDDLVGKTIAVTVTASKDGFLPAAAGSATVGPVAAAPLAQLTGSAKVSVTGEAVVGGTLTATVSDNTFPTGTALSYQWFYNGGQFGGPVDGATQATFSPSADLVGLNVGVIVTATLDGFDPASITSSTSVVRAAATQVSPQPSPQPIHVTVVKAAPVKAGAKKLKLTLPGVTSAPGKVKVYDGKKKIGTATITNGTVVVKLKKKLTKGKHKVSLKYAGSSAVAAFSKTVKVKVK